MQAALPSTKDGPGSKQRSGSALGPDSSSSILGNAPIQSIGSSNYNNLGRNSALSSIDHPPNQILSTQQPSQPQSSNQNVNPGGLSKSISMPMLNSKYNIHEVDPKLETEAEKKAKADLMKRLQ